ncbi:F-box/FBD/LRR-repeat protein At1g13570-like [Bidens hawaiensis]|uniref:F-box/FBD/LRR-repeat protein At1g13570-like n=1 Tax=Bidens hawaiensis TaxID=980011 RepID=UPI00404AB136
MVTLPSSSGCIQSKCKLAKAIFHVLLLHKGPQNLRFRVGALHMESEFAQMISYLAIGNTVKELSFINDNRSYKLPFSFFSLQGLEYVALQNCTFEPPLTFSKFSCLRFLLFLDVDVSAQMLHRFLSNCPLLEKLYLVKYQEGIDFVAGENIFTFVDLFRCMPSIRLLQISNHYIKYLSAGGMPHKFPTSLVHLKDLSLHVTEQNEISSALCIIRSSPELAQIRFLMYRDEKLPVQQTPVKFLDPENHPELKLDYLEILEIKKFSNSPLEMEVVKLIMAKSPELENVEIELDSNISVGEELKILRDFVLLSFPRASASAKLTIVRP